MARRVAAGQGGAGMIFSKRETTRHGKPQSLSPNSGPGRRDRNGSPSGRYAWGLHPRPRCTALSQSYNIPWWPGALTQQFVFRK